MSGIKSAVIVLVLANIAQTSSFSVSRASLHNRDVTMKSSGDFSGMMKKCSKVLATSFIAINLITNMDVSSARAEDAAAAPVAAVVTAPATSTENIPKVPLYTKKGTDTQAYSDIGRGFRMLRYDFNQKLKQSLLSQILTNFTLTSYQFSLSSDPSVITNLTVLDPVMPLNSLL